MQKNHLKKLFNLEGYVLDRVEHREDGTFLYCHLQRKSMAFRGERSMRFSGKRVRTLPHMMMEDKMAVLVVTQRRFYFPRHRTKRWESLPQVGRRKQSTDVFRINTLRELQRDNYSGTGHKRHKSHMFPIHLLDSLPCVREWRAGMARIGMDGKGVGHNKAVHHIADLDRHRPQLVLPGLSQERLKKN
jgi:hypothetical protein